MKRILSVFLILSASAILVSAQGENAANKETPSKSPIKSSPAPTKTKKAVAPVQNAPKKSSVSSSRDARALPTVRKQPTKSAQATLTITTNPPESEISLSNANGSVLEQESVLTDTSGTLVIDSLPLGKYTLIVRKAGYRDEQRQISLTGKRANSVSVTLAPTTGVLAVAPDVENAVIDIEGIGEFYNRVERVTLNPGIYRVRVEKDGYEPEMREVSIRIGETSRLGVALKPIALEKLLQNAETFFQAGNYKETLSACRLILEQNDAEPRANLLMGYGYFYSKRPRESRFYLARAPSLQTDVELPVKIYQKEKNSEILTDGILKINRNNLSFSSDKKPELNFAVAPAAVSSLEIKQEKKGASQIASPKPDSIELKAVVQNAKKTEKKTLRFYPRQAFARVAAQNKAEIAGCAECADGKCVCQTEIQAVYELMLNWKTGSYPRRVDAFSGVAPPSPNFTRFEAQNFSLNVPSNWQKVSQTNNDVWFAPEGGFSRNQTGTRTQYGYAVNVGVLPISANDLRAETESFYRALLSGDNGYLEQQSPAKETYVSGKKALVSTFAGFGIETGEEEFVQIYTSFTKEGNLFYVLTITPFAKRQEYRQVFRPILNSMNF